jgi:Terpene cyclase DEP1
VRWLEEQTCALPARSLPLVLCTDDDVAMNKPLLLLILVPFSALSLVALWHHGYVGLFTPAFQNFGAAQVLVDLVIALGLFLVWMWRDAAKTGRNPWPWLVLTVAAGSFGPLLYLLTRKGSSGD